MLRRNLPGAVQLLMEQSLQTLVSLLDKDVCREQAAEVVCRLLTAAPTLRRAASDAGAVGKLVGKLGQPGCTASQQVWLLRALELLTRDHEDPRQQFLESSGMPCIQKALEHHSKEVCTRFLHRGVMLSCFPCLQSAIR